MPEDYCFYVPYTETGFAKVCIEANSEDEARKRLANNDVDDMMDTDVGTVTYDADEAERY
jgi:hypothetical protein